MISSLITVFTVLMSSLTILAAFIIQRERYKASNDKVKKPFEIAKKITRLLLHTSNYASSIQEIADFLPKELNFATGVIALYDKNTNVLRRVAASNTKEAREAIQSLSIPFNKIAVPVDNPHNLMSRSLVERKEFETNSVYDVFIPVFSLEESAKIQKIMGTKSTIIYPIYVEDTPLGVFVASSNKTVDEITEYEREIIKVFVDGAGIALRNSQLFNSLEVANKELLKLNKIKDEFVFIATHDLKTPVTAIDGYISLIEKEKPNFSSEIKENFEEVKQASGRLKQLVNDLLQVARGESGTIKVDISNVDINETINKIIKEVEPIAKEKNVTITANLDTVNKNILGDATKLPEIMENLLSNAIKFNKPAGNITISTKKVDKMLEMTIKDTGYGIPENEKTKVFEKFFKYRGNETRDVPGTGLGLFVVKMLIEKMNGRIAFTSVENEGTTFIVHLPLVN